MDDVQKAAALSAFRTLLGVAGGFLTAKGYATDANVEAIIGALMILVPIGWGVVEKYRRESKVQDRVEQAYNAGATGMPSPAQPKEVVR